MQTHFRSLVVQVFFAEVAVESVDDRKADLANDGTANERGIDPGTGTATEDAVDLPSTVTADGEVHRRRGDDRRRLRR